MTSSLQSLFQEIAKSRNQEELRSLLSGSSGTSHVIPHISEYFAAKRCNLFFHQQLPSEETAKSSLLRKALSLDYNPVLRYLVERHTAVHDEIVLPPGVWKTICPRADHAHVMVGPIVHQGQLIGGMALTRDCDSPAFNQQNLADLSALCLHLSTWFASRQLESQQININSFNTKNIINISRLTPRELEIAELVAQGLKNSQIGEKLCISEHTVKQALKRIFRKLEVSSRAEMVIQLFSNANFSTT
ncbi:MAG: LuxR family transcriptional regulator [Methylacidiphilales bacterium]|nr:LuxR family transcriptional regulator [Candidatus Methylacidiphilales bacterium]NJR15601.1 LuxR family transcriptional regulator [Calothrix sp. CSU_2_0]